MPLKSLFLNGCEGLKDFTPLADCKDLECLTLPAHCKGKLLDPLRNLPNLKWLDYGSDYDKRLPAEEFWKKYGGGK